MNIVYDLSIGYIYFSIQQKIKFQHGSQGFKKTDDLASHVLSDSEIKKITNEVPRHNVAILLHSR